MIGSFITRGLLLIFGYVYPAYECYKTVELNKPDIQQLRFWCQYWILVAGLTACERIGDAFVGWIPMYGEAKLAFFIYLWFPKTQGTTYVYSSFFRPYVTKHETEIDRNILELRTRAGDMAMLYCQKAASYGQTRIFEILRYLASQSTPPRPAQPKQKGTVVQRANGNMPLNRSSNAATTQGQPSSPSMLSSTKQDGNTTEVRPPLDSKEATASTATKEQEKMQVLSESSKSLTSTDEQPKQIDEVPPAATNENEARPASRVMVFDKGSRLTRANSRKIHPAAAPNRRTKK